MSEQTARFTSSVAHLTETEGEEYVVHGVALGEDDLTRGKNGLKRWPRRVLEPAAASLAGTDATFRVDDPTEHGGGAVGRVTQAAYEPGVGVVYEATLTDADVAKQLSLGQLEVSIEGRATEGVEEDDETGAAILNGFEFTGLAIVEKGASPSNHSAAGSAADNPAVAALSAGDIEEALDTDPSTDPDPESDDAADTAEASGSASNDSTETMSDEDNPSDPSDPEDTTNDSPDVEALLTRLDNRDERIETLEAELSEAEEEITEVKRAYAATLAEDGPFDEDDLVEAFGVAQLREKYEERGAELAPEPEPDVQAGDNPDEETAELSAEDRDEVRAMLSRADTVATLGPGGEKRAEELRSEAAELAGVDDHTDINLEDF